MESQLCRILAVCLRFREFSLSLSFLICKKSVDNNVHHEGWWGDLIMCWFPQQGSRSSSSLPRVPPKGSPPFLLPPSTPSSPHESPKSVKSPRWALALPLWKIGEGFTGGTSGWSSLLFWGDFRVVDIGKRALITVTHNWVVLQSFRNALLSMSSLLFTTNPWSRHYLLIFQKRLKEVHWLG